MREMGKKFETPSYGYQKNKMDPHLIPNTSIVLKLFPDTPSVAPTFFHQFTKISRVASQLSLCL